MLGIKTFSDLKIEPTEWRRYLHQHRELGCWRGNAPDQARPANIGNNEGGGRAFIRERAACAEQETTGFPLDVSASIAWKPYGTGLVVSLDARRRSLVSGGSRTLGERGRSMRPVGGELTRRSHQADGVAIGKLGGTCRARRLLTEARYVGGPSTAAPIIHDGLAAVVPAIVDRPPGDARARVFESRRRTYADPRAILAHQHFDRNDLSMDSGSDLRGMRLSLSFNLTSSLPMPDFDSHPVFEAVTTSLTSEFEFHLADR